MRRVLLILLGAGPVACSGGGTCKSAATWYEDRDRDGYGSDAGQTVSCDAPAGFADNADDCDDRDATAYPGAPEICGDGRVNACEGTEEEASATCTLGALASAASAASLSLAGAEAGDALGTSVVGVGDFNGDTIPDALVGAPGAGGSGRAYLYKGTATGAVTLDEASSTFVGAADGDGLGATVAAAGDLNADREGDLLLGAPQAGSGAGAVWMFDHAVYGEVALSEADGAITGAAAGDLAGTSAVAIGDYNGDGNPDLLVGAPGSEDGLGSAYVVYGPMDGSVSLADDPRRLYGEVAGGRLGTAVLAMDLDGDGDPNLAVGAPLATLASTTAVATDLAPGAVYTYSAILSTPTSVTGADSKLFGDIDGDLAGFALCDIGDANGDGYGDLAIGAPHQNTGAEQRGAVYILLGPVTVHTYGTLNTISDAKFLGAAAGDHAGTSITSSDVDADGIPDLIVGAPGESTAGASAGAVYTAIMPITGVVEASSVASHQMFGEAAGDAVGAAVGTLGDLDGDGISELLIGAPGVGEGVGAAWVMRLAGY